MVENPCFISKKHRKSLLYCFSLPAARKIYIIKQMKKPSEQAKKLFYCSRYDFNRDLKSEMFLISLKFWGRELKNLGPWNLKENIRIFVRGVKRWYDVLYLVLWECTWFLRTNIFLNASGRRPFSDRNINFPIWNK